ncbi:MAG TPA: hypothetical protein VLJ84_04570, partial [Usitatibacter sp.]|nr:hypothetical protein [Usitatibacter sp.]
MKCRWRSRSSEARFAAVTSVQAKRSPVMRPLSSRSGAPALEGLDLDHLARKRALAQPIGRRAALVRHEGRALADDLLARES